MMKNPLRHNLRIIFALLAIFFNATLLRGAENPPLNLTDHIIFGEKHTYAANWNGFPVGVIHTRVWNFPRQLNGQTTAMLEMNIESNDFLSLFYPVSTTMKSFIALENGSSLLFRRRTREGDYRANDRVIYDYQFRNALGKNEPLAIVEQFNGEVLNKSESRKIAGFVCDPLALVWHLRYLPLDKIGAQATVMVCDRYHYGEIIFTVIASEEITIPAQGKFSCWRIKPQTVNFGDDTATIRIDKIFIDRQTRLIRRAEIAIPIGKITINLTNG